VTVTGTARGTRTNTPTITPTGTKTGTPTHTGTPTITPTRTRTATVTATATATVALVPGCVLTVRPSTSNLIAANPGTTMWILYHALPNSVITTTISPPGGLYPAQATVMRMLMGATPLTGVLVPGGYRYQFQGGADGNALLRFTIPATARPGTAVVTASDPQPCAATATFAVR
jgi:hypothetical protein